MEYLAREDSRALAKIGVNVAVLVAVAAVLVVVAFALT